MSDYHHYVRDVSSEFLTTTSPQEHAQRHPSSSASALSTSIPDWRLDSPSVEAHDCWYRFEYEVPQSLGLTQNCYDRGSLQFLCDVLREYCQDRGERGPEVLHLVGYAENAHLDATLLCHHLLPLVKRTLHEVTLRGIRAPHNEHPTSQHGDAATRGNTPNTNTTTTAATTTATVTTILADTITPLLLDSLMDAEHLQSFRLQSPGVMLGRPEGRLVAESEWWLVSLETFLLQHATVSVGFVEELLLARDYACGKERLILDDCTLLVQDEYEIGSAINPSALLLEFAFHPIQLRQLQLGGGTIVELDGGRRVSPILPADSLPLLTRLLRESAPTLQELNLLDHPTLLTHPAHATEFFYAVTSHPSLARLEIASCHLQNAQLAALLRLLSTESSLPTPSQLEDLDVDDNPDLSLDGEWVDWIPRLTRLATLRFPTRYLDNEEATNNASSPKPALLKRLRQNTSLTACLFGRRYWVPSAHGRVERHDVRSPEVLAPLWIRNTLLQVGQQTLALWLHPPPNNGSSSPMRSNNYNNGRSNGYGRSSSSRSLNNHNPHNLVHVRLDALAPAILARLGRPEPPPRTANATAAALYLPIPGLTAIFHFIRSATQSGQMPLRVCTRESDFAAYLDMMS